MLKNVGKWIFWAYADFICPLGVNCGGFSRPQYIGCTNCQPYWTFGLLISTIRNMPYISEQYRNRKYNTLRPRQNGRQFGDEMSGCIFFNENAWIAIRFPLNFVPKGLIDNILVHVIAWSRALDKPLPGPKLTYICVTGLHNHSTVVYVIRRDLFTVTC